MPHYYTSALGTPALTLLHPWKESQAVLLKRIAKGPRYWLLNGPKEIAQDVVLYKSAETVRSEPDGVYSRSVEDGEDAFTFRLFRTESDALEFRNRVTDMAMKRLRAAIDTLDPWMVMALDSGWSPPRTTLSPYAFR